MEKIFISFLKKDLFNQKPFPDNETIMIKYAGLFSFPLVVFLLFLQCTDNKWTYLWAPVWQFNACGQHLMIRWKHLALASPKTCIISFWWKPSKTVLPLLHMPVVFLQLLGQSSYPGRAKWKNTFMTLKAKFKIENSSPISVGFLNPFQYPFVQKIWRKIDFKETLQLRI